MAVRKLAPPESQPASFAFTPESEAFAEREIAKYPPGRQASAIIALLGRAQEQCGGWLPQKAIEAVADRLGMAPIRAMEVATFYTMFNLEPVGRYFVQFCGTTPCALRGASGIKKVLERRIGAERHISADGLFSWLEVECLGACCNAPMVQIGRRSSEPEGAVNTLQDPTLFDGSVVGAWRSRFEEEALKVVTDEAAAIAASLPEESKAAKPPAGRAIESDAADTPAKRVKEGETPVRAPEQKRASSRSRATASKGKKTDEPVPPPQSGKSYVAKPSDPAAGRAVSESATTPVAGTPPSEGGKRDGSESKPDVPVDKNKTP